MSSIDGGRDDSQEPTSRLASVPLRWLVAGVTAIALGISGFFGGLDKVRENKVPAVAVNTVVEAPPFRVSVHAARVWNELPPLRHNTDGDRWVGVRVTVVNTSKTSVAMMSRSIEIHGVEGLREQRPAAVYLERDSTYVMWLHPEMTEQIVVLWEQDPAAAVPTEATVSLIGHEFRPPVFGGETTWLGPSARATVRLPVEDRR